MILLQDDSIAILLEKPIKAIRLNFLINISNSDMYTIEFETIYPLR